MQTQAVEEFQPDDKLLVSVFGKIVTLEDLTLEIVIEDDLLVEAGGWTDPLGQLASTVMDFIEDVGNYIINSIKTTLNSISYSLRSAIDGLASSIQSAIGNLQYSIQSVLSGVQSAIQNVQNAISGIVSTIQSSLQSIASNIQASISNVVSVVQNVISTMQSGFSSIINQISGIVNAVQSALANVTSVIQNVITTVQSGFQNVINVIQGIVGNIQNIFQNVVSQIQNIYGMIQNAFQNVTQTISGIINTMQQGLQNILTSIQSFFQNIQTTIQNIMQGVTSTLQNIASTITTGLQNIITNIREVLGGIQNTLQSMFQNVTQTIQNVISGVQGAIQNVAEFVRNIPNIIQSAFQNITSTIQGIVSGIQSVMQNIMNIIRGIPETISKVVKPIGEAIKDIVIKIPEIPSKVYEFLKPIIEPIIDKIRDIPERMKEIASAFQGFVNPLVGISQFFEQIRNSVLDFLTKIPEYLGTIVQFFVDISKDPEGWFRKNIVQPLTELFSNIGEQIWEAIPDNIKLLFENVQKSLQSIGETLLNVASKIRDSVVNFIKDPIGSIKGFLQLIVSGFKSLVGALWDNLMGFSSWISEKFMGFATGIYDVLVKPVVNVFSNVAEKVFDLLHAPFEKVVTTLRDKFRQVKEPITNIITSLLSPLVENLGKTMESIVVKTLSKEKHSQVYEVITLLGGLAVGLVGSQYIFRAINLGLHYIASYFDRFQIRVQTGWKVKFKGEQRARFIPLGVGIGGSVGEGGEIEYKIPIYSTLNLGATLRHLASEFKQYPDEFGRALLYGWAIWLSQPYSRLANYLFRDMLPIELPSLSELRDITRRHMPLEDKFKENLEKMRRYLALYGYNSDIVSWLTTPITEEGWYVPILDRFGKQRKIPISLLYELPTPSDFVRMMLHDIIIHPDYFVDVMQMKGYTEDTTMMYYLLHFRYPTLEKLWEFYCRARADMLWIDEKALPEVVTKEEREIIEKYGLGEVPVHPAKLNCMNKPDIQAKILQAIRQYAKWWDYAFFNWFTKEGIKFPSDRLIMLDLMADIPQRIDARWMYKWGIIDDRQLWRIVTARGMHPKWVDTITVAECMNALQEERTFARTGVINVFKEGFTDLSGLEKTLSHLTDVEILGKKYPVKFLKGEVKLLSLRAKYDRVIDIMRDYFRNQLRAVSEHIISYDEMIKNLKDEIKLIATSLNLTNLKIDEEYFKPYKHVAETYKTIRTIDRIRYWTRYMLYRLLQRFSEGFMSKEEFENIINDIVRRGKLTKEEHEYFTIIAQFMYEGFYKRALADGVLRKLSRGIISEEEAKQRLMELGLTSEVAEALIEKYAKTYTLSISTLLSYADEVLIPEELLKKKMELMGVPEDEREIILQVFKIRPIKDEISKVIRRLIDSYIEGYMEEDALIKELRKLGKRDEEIQLIVTFARIEKALEIYKLRIDAILNKVKRGAITIEQAKTELSKFIKDKEIIEALIEKSVRIYSLSVSQLISYAEYVDIPEEFIKKKLEILGVPEDEVPIILQVFKIRPIKDERAKMIRSVIDAYIDGFIDKETFKKNLQNLGKSQREIQILEEFADFEKSQARAKLFIDATLNKLRRGAITIEQAKRELEKVIVDKPLIDAIIEKYVRTSVWTPDKLVSMAEYIPIDIQDLVNKAKMFGYPEEEVKKYPAYVLARNLNEEIGRVVNELVYLYIYDVIDEETLRREIDKVRTLNGEVKKYGVDWIVIDDLEKELIIQRAKLRKMREEARKQA